ncbi:MAG: NAD(P)-dependent oxidoreductase [Myxococcaceae bacterium]
MRILVTGSEGLIGTALSNNLENLGFVIRRFDKKFPTYHPSHGNILSAAHLREAIDGCDGIIHLAAVSRVIWGQIDPNLCWATNSDGTIALLNAAARSQKKPWVLYASSREVYGNPKQLPAVETTSYNPVNIYGESKVDAEKAVLEARSNGLKTAIVRYSNVYGSLNDHHDRVVPAFCKAAALGKPIKVEGSENTFDFTHIDDTVEGTIKIIKKMINEAVNLPAFHLTTGKQTSLSKLAKLANNAGKKESQIIETPPRSYDVPRFYGDSSETQKYLDWKPRVNINEGVRKLTTLFREAFV